MAEKSNLALPLGALASNIAPGPTSARSAGGEFDNDVIKRKGRTLLTDKSVRRIQVPQHPLPLTTGGGVSIHMPG